MPVITKNNTQIDFTDDGEGKPVILIHSSVSGNRQWRQLTEALKEHYRVLAVNLFGYGHTTPWTNNSPQTLSDQARLVLELCEMADTPMRLVGHSFGGSVALKSAHILGDKVVGLVLLDPNPFYLLAQNKRWRAYEEAKALRDHVKKYGKVGDWEKVAKRFSDYWVGDGTWEMMSTKRKNAFIQSIPPNFHEWDGVLNETTPIETWKSLPAKTLVVYGAETKRPIRKIVELFFKACPHWFFKEVSSCGHMGPLTHPDLINPIVSEFLDGINNDS
jgi:pimeloyl-ACP methyl ester carboxylesterase